MIGCFLFGRRGREGLRELRKDSFEFAVDGEGMEYVTLGYNEHDKNHHDLDREAEETDKRMYAEEGELDRPVLTLKLYISKLNPRNDSLFQRPNSSWQSSTRWYDQMAVGKTPAGKCTYKPVHTDLVRITFGMKVFRTYGSVRTMYIHSRTYSVRPVQYQN